MQMTMTGAPGASMGGGGSTLQDLLAQFKTGSQQANTDSLAQYQNLLGTVRGASKSVLGAGGLLSTAGNSAIAGIKDQTKNQLGELDQNLLNSGRFNSSIRDTNRVGIQNKGLRAENQVNEQVAGQKAGYTADFAKLMADSILSRTNDPQTEMYMQLIQRLAQSHPQAQQTMFSNAGSINALNAPNTFGGGTFGSGSIAGGTTTPRPGDQPFYQTMPGQGAAANNPGYSQNLLNAMQYPNGGFSVDMKGYQDPATRLSLGL